MPDHIESCILRGNILTGHSLSFPHISRVALQISLSAKLSNGLLKLETGAASKPAVASPPNICDSVEEYFERRSRSPRLSGRIGYGDDGLEKVPTVRLLRLRDSTDGQRQKTLGAKTTSCYVRGGKSVSAFLIRRRFSQWLVVNVFVFLRCHRYA